MPTSDFTTLTRSPGNDVEVFFADLENKIRQHPALHHPFLKRFAQEKLDIAQMRAFASQHYLYSRRFARNLAAVIANVPDEQARTLLVLNMYEEIGEPSRVRDRAHILLLEAGLVNGDQLASALLEVAARKHLDRDVVAVLIERGIVSRGEVGALVDQHLKAAKQLTHPALFRRFMDSLGLAGEMLQEAEPLAETELVNFEYKEVCRNAHWLESMGAMGPGTECVVPSIYTHLLQGIERSGLLGPSDYIFWTVHVHCDDGHGRSIIEAMKPHAGTAEHQALITRGAMRVLNCRKRWFDGLLRHVFKRDTSDGLTKSETMRVASGGDQRKTTGR